MQTKIKAKKSLGQNFLKSKRILEEIVRVGEISNQDFVIEIGPGKGSLTKKILETGAKVWAFEKDSRLINLLEEKFFKEINSGQLTILEKDILNFDLEQINKKYKLIANIPYYITGEILEKFLSSNKQPTSAVLMVQKEVADRIIARDNKESLLSISVKIYCQPKYIKKVPAKLFSPQPKVDSAIIKLNKISKERFELSKISEKEFFQMVKTGFSHKRKYLISNLKKVSQNIEQKFQKCQINNKIRAEKLSTEDWICLLKN